MEILNAQNLFILCMALPVLAFVYSSVGHGGASGYLALMALLSFPLIFMKPTALILNIAVSGFAFWFFKKNRHFEWRLFYPFAVTSIPAAFIGGFISIDNLLYRQILGIFLFIAVLRIAGVFGKRNEQIRSLKVVPALAIGSIIGLFSGMIGIGGGIILTPVILLLGWGNVKQAAAVSALFILVNSLAGIIGFVLNGHQIPAESFLLVPIVLTGGVVGAYYGSNKFSPVVLKYVLSGVLVLAFIKLLSF